MRLIDADSLELFPNNPESGTNEMINNWIDECGLSNLELYITEKCTIDIEHALTKLCWKVIQGYINVIETEPTAYDVDKVVEQLIDNSRLMTDSPEAFTESVRCGENPKEEYVHNVVNLYDAIEIVKAGGIDEETSCG